MSELVDFERVESTHSQNERNELMKHVAQLFCLTADRADDDLMAAYDDVMVRLTAMVEDEALSFVSEKLAELPRAPEGIVSRLAFGPIEVARPVLERSPVLTDHELFAIIGTKSMEHLDAIAGRPDLSEPITELLVDRGNVTVKLRVSENEGARFSQQTLHKLIADSAQDEALHAALAKRHDLPRDMAAAVSRLASEEVRQAIRERNAPAMPERPRLVSASDFETVYDFDAAYRTVTSKLKVFPANEATLAKLLDRGRYPEAVVVLALCAGVTVDDARYWTTHSEPRPFLTVCRALGFSTETVSSFLFIGPWSHKLTREQRVAALSMYKAMPEAMARQIFEQWRVDHAESA